MINFVAQASSVVYSFPDAKEYVVLSCVNIPESSGLGSAISGRGALDGSHGIRFYYDSRFMLDAGGFPTLSVSRFSPANAAFFTPARCM
jgi:hypothetical protein